MNELLLDFLHSLLQVCIVLGVLMGVVAYTVLLERRLLARMQQRMGPNRVGPMGLFQPIADGIKLLTKEIILPRMAHKTLFYAAPLIPVISAFLVVIAIPMGSPKYAQILNISVGLLYVLGVSSLSVYGIILAGWSSGSKYPLLGGMRAGAQMISYEIPLGLSLVTVLMASGTFKLTEIVQAQTSGWFIFKQPISFIVMLICVFAETNRTPFDLPEAETELAGGYNTEYSGMRFAFFFLAEYIHMYAAAFLITILFLGGWLHPFADTNIGKYFLIIPPAVWLFGKVFCIIFFFIWIRATYPRLRFDQLMDFGWKILIPIALLNIGIYAWILF